MSTLNSSPDGMKVLMEALIKKYSKKWFPTSFF
jgi:hypothetical protein